MKHQDIGINTQQAKGLVGQNSRVSHEVMVDGGNLHLLRLNFVLLVKWQ